MGKAPPIESLRAQLALQLERIQASEQGVRDGFDPDELHRFRVATRRSRALIRASRTLVGEQLAPLNAELRWLASLTGPVRDLDVLLGNLAPRVEQLGPDRAGGAAILAALAEERRRVREGLVDALQGERYGALVAQFGSTLPTLSAVEGDVSLAKLARRALRHVESAYEALGDEPPDEELHALRIKVKRARYAAELAAPAKDGQVERLVEELTVLQDLIGANQDAAVTEKRLRALAPRESLLAAGRLIEQERAQRREVRRELPKAWRRLARARRKV